jgi:hypothetical protein
MAMLVPPVLLLVAAALERVPWWLAAPAAAAWLAGGLLRGLAIEWLIEARYFPPSVQWRWWPPALRVQRARIEQLPDSPVEHVFCCTDLLRPGPVYFSSRVFETTRGCFCSGVHGGWVERSAGRVLLAAAVRASAAFPGIPPRRLRFHSTSAECWCHVDRSLSRNFDEKCERARTFCLADGGVWNNLGTHVLRELKWDWPGYDVAMIVADAAVDLPEQRAAPYCVPGWALVRSLLRAVGIQFANTIQPRLDAMQHLHTGRLLRDRLDLAAVEADCSRFNLTSDDVELLEELDKRGYLRTVESFDIPVSVSGHPLSLLNLLSQIASDRAWGSGNWPEIGPLWELRNQDLDVFRLADIDIEKIGTHLGRLRREEAIALLARGYLKTFLETWEFNPLSEDEIRALTELPKRFRRLTAPRKTAVA